MSNVAQLRVVPAPTPAPTPVSATWNPELLVFHEADHAYHYDGARVPSVTQVLDCLHSFAGVSEAVLDAAKERGTHVHLACQYFDEGDIDESALTPQISGYLEGWKKFCRDCDPKWRLIEQPFYHPVLRFAGTPDRFGDLTVKGRRVSMAQVDIKTAAASHPVWGVQTAAYNHVVSASYPGAERARRFTCQLRPDGRYRLIEWTEPGDWPVFVSLTTLRTFQQKHSL